ncbi:UDP-N-acetylglucosamine 2-epimerase [Lysobacter daejeonensis GH1-9]|uniref:UDP-N-acetylglucosamine 2-epimerase (non-hydrolyzing) n=1 Tax=Lysobacter daejeonensis GH1-9 TaxID=1385517 RepID=A0A0A0EVY1_9GAMM|nr:UDP-N-acetylglucosamine 2-epimerase (non-hydrolyzing) [Lysobacter daejeonensis]KGM55116.1 UDP-N-acetylglucosamine 2-epimerase [Lysobacter daejeonensis GH1-9]
MSNKKKILIVVGTRPEAIKMAPVILALRAEPWAEVTVLATAQHRQMLDQVMAAFAISTDIDLNLMRPNQSLTELTARILHGMDGVFEARQFDAVLVQGDTTTVMAVAMAAFYRGIPVGHVEAGLRTGDIRNPFPEEMNRVVAGRLSRWHFAPTTSAQQNLIREGYPAADVHVTGNTVIDALMAVASRELDMGVDIPVGKKLVLVTSHRRENFGEPLRGICLAVRDLVERHGDIHVLYPVHPNPNVVNTVNEILAGHPAITLSQPLDYLPFVAAMKRAHLILSDSGGVQEEAPALGKPVLVMRRETERPEAVTEGVVRLVGPDRDAIVRNASLLLTDDDAYAHMARGGSPYGDGQASRRIVAILREGLAA